MTRLALFLAALAAALLLSGCGIRGDLDRPAPLWGADPRAEDADAADTDAGAEDDEDEDEDEDDEEDFDDLLADPF